LEWEYGLEVGSMKGWRIGSKAGALFLFILWGSIWTSEGGRERREGG
jgi:hypothetical protein